MAETEHVAQALDRLDARVKELETICLRLEAERDAHMHVIEQLFKALIPHD